MRTHDELLSLAEGALKLALARGAEAAEVFVVDSAVTKLAAQGEYVVPKEIHEAGMGMRALVDGRLGVAGSPDITRPDALARQAIQAARNSPKGVFPGFATPRAAVHDAAPIHAAIATPDPARLEALAEVGIRPLVSVPTTSFAELHLRSISTRFAVANSEGVRAWDQGARETLNLGVRARRGTTERTSSDLLTGTTATDPKEVEALAARVLVRNDAAIDTQPLTKATSEVVLHSLPAGQIVKLFVDALSGALVHAKRSPLAGEMGRLVASPLFSLHDDPRPSDGPQRLRVDHEGVPTQRLTPVDAGHLRAVFHDWASGHATGEGSNGRGLRPGGWAGGVAPRPISTRMENGDETLAGLIEGADRAIILADPLAGAFIANANTGDFSLTSPHGLLVERGRVRHAVPQLTVAGNVFRLVNELKGVTRETREIPEGIFPSIRVGGVSCAT